MSIASSDEKRLEAIGPQRRRGGRAVALASAATALIAPLAFPLLAGCGGGGNATASSSTATRSAKVTFAFKWPATKAVPGSRSVPESANSILITITDAVGYSQTQSVNRPPTDSNQTVSATFVGLAPGEATITFASYTGHDLTGSKIDTTPGQTVTLNPAILNTVILSYRDAPFDSVSITPGADQSIVRGQTEQLAVATYSDENLIKTSPAGSWTSSNTDVVTVSSTGLVSAVGLGSATVTFTPAGAAALTPTATLHITVTVPYSSVRLSTVSSTGSAPGQTTQLTATAYDTDNTTVLATNVPGAWTSSDTSVATIDQNGLVTALAVGSTTISFTDSQYGKSAQVTVDVVQPFASVVITPDNPTVIQTKTQQLTVTGYDTDGKTVVQTNPPGTWSSDNTNVATVSTTGLVTGVYPGTATLHFTDSTYGKTAAVTVTVKGGDSTVTIQ